MTLDEALAAGDFSRAAELAAEIQSPAAYRDAMVRIYEARQPKGTPTMPNETTTAAAPKSKLRNSKDEFALEPPVEPGKVPTGVIDELRLLRTAANDASTDFREAIKVQSEKFHLKPSALRRYVVALGP